MTYTTYHMHKIQYLTLILILIQNIPAIAADAWIRVNHLGYLPHAEKKAVLISESARKLRTFSIHDALTHEEYVEMESMQSCGSFDKFNSCYLLDFTTFTQEGAFYIKINDLLSPTIYINPNIYVGKIDRLLHFLHEQRISSEKPGAWWFDGAQTIQDNALQAAAVHQLLFAYQQHPAVFGDTYNDVGEKEPNGIPDVLEEAAWGLNWLVQPDLDDISAAEAGKISAAFAIGAEVFRTLDPDYADRLLGKAIELYRTGKDNPGTIRVAETSNNLSKQEENWKDDMQLAATHLYFITFDKAYLTDALDFGAAEPVPQWLFSHCDKPLRFYPYINWSPSILTQLEHPQTRKLVEQNLFITLQRAALNAQDNPFHIGITFSENSNNKIAALHNLCQIYRQHTQDSTFFAMEEALHDWLFGLNPWGIAMTVGFPETGKTPENPYAKAFIQEDQLPVGGLVNGAVSRVCAEQADVDRIQYDGPYERFQTDWAMYRDDVNDKLTNHPNIDGTTALIHLISARQAAGDSQHYFDKNQYDRGAVTRFNPAKKQIAVVFVGHQYSDGYRKISKALKKHKITASFFFSGDFLRNRRHKRIIKKLWDQEHYIGPASNHFEQLVSWDNPALTRVRKNTFLRDLKENYETLKKFGISREDAPFFFPPFELYNDSISRWCREMGIYVVRSTPGTYANLDYTFPEMRENYYTAKEIMDNIMEVEITGGLNGYLLQFNLGTNPGRKDKFYNRLPALFTHLKKEGYTFVDLFTATKLATKPIPPDRKRRQK